MSEITIIIPVYQVEQFLERCVESLLNQTFKDFEIVLVDDGSTDHCGMMCDAFAEIDARVYVIHQDNGGLSAARNAGLDWAFSKSDSSWIGFVDSDDWVQPQYLEWLIRSANANQSQVVIGGYALTNGEPIHPLTDFTYSLWKPEDYYLHDVINATVSWGKLYKKSCFKDIRFPLGKWHEDEYIFYKILFQCFEIPVIEQPLYAYFQNPQGIMRRRWSIKRLDRLAAFEEQIEFFIEHGYLDIARRRMSDLILNNLDGQKKIRECEEINDRTKDKLIKDCRKQLRRILTRYRKYNWFAYYKSERNKEIYAVAFPGIRVARDIWRPVKEKFMTVPITRELVHGAGDMITEKERIQLLIKYIKSSSRARVILLQTPLHGNLGDQAIAQAEIDLLRRMKLPFCDFPWTEGIEKRCAKVTSWDKLILLHGGGYLGQLWQNEEERIRNTIIAFRNHKIIVLPQTVYFDLETEEGRKLLEESRSIYESHQNLTVFLREDVSYRFMKENMPSVHVELVPDIVFLLKWKALNLNRRDVLVVMRHDKERTLSAEEYEKMLLILGESFEKQRVTDTVIPGNIDISRRQELLEKKLQEFSSASLVVTDRLHGMIFAAVTETPCIVINSLSHKVRGSYEWIKELGYIRMVSTIDEIPDVVNQLLSTEPQYNQKKYLRASKPLMDAIMQAIK